MFNSSLPDVLCWSSHTVPGVEGRGHIALNTAALFPPWRRLKTSTITVVSIP